MANEIIFQASVPNTQLRQGEVISNFTEYVYDPVAEEVDAINHPFCVVASQECDLARDYEARQDQRESSVKSILLLMAAPVEQARNAVGPSNIWKRAKQNDDERWHVLEAAGVELDQLSQGVPALVIDFRKFFTVPPAEIYRQLADPKAAVRRCLLLSPYREHLQTRAMAYLGRVALDRDHEV
jgi:hypothetical protein